MIAAQRRRAALVLVLAGATAAVARTLVPTDHVADTRPKVALALLVPERFGDWVVDNSTAVILPAPDVQASLAKAYNDVLARTYINREGYRVMLSIAYGGDQSDGVSMHRPEVCYPAQGFDVQRVWGDELALGGQRCIAVSRATTRMGPRHEPLTYWIISGDEVVARGFDARRVQLKYTLRGKIPDGMLVRISSIDPDSTRAFAVQDHFAQALIEAVDSAFRVRLAGPPAPA